MVKQQSCAILVNASALCGIEQEVMKDESNVSAIAEISAELARERQRNAELMQRISLLETQLQQRDDQLIGLSNLQINSSKGKERRFRKFKRQKSETSTDQCLQMTPKCLSMPFTNENRPVKWMSMGDCQIFECEKSNYGDSFADCHETDDTDDEINEDLDENDREHIDREDSTAYVNSVHKQNKLLEYDNLKTYVPCLDTSSENISLENYDTCKIFMSRQESRGCGSGSLSLQKQSAKVAFCPKEVNRIIELEELLLKNAHSHTIRKIIVFASLGIRHGSEEMYELDLNHFRILQKGEPYLSPKNPGEHVVYENPGIRRKVFYPNRQNPTLCPVRILEEEEGMRPSDAGCPSFLFLCIKYGGSTRNLPQNEYVRQRMGRNKLKSFGPLICRMAMLSNIRNGSFFFKALGITLLFMAGFSDDLVRRETKYKNLDLLQKYYRSDEDAEGESLFLSQPTTGDQDSQYLAGKTFSTKAKIKKRKIPNTKLHDSPKLAKFPDSAVTAAPSTSSPPKQFGLMGYNTSSQAQSMPSQSPITYPNFPPHFQNAFLPMMYWPPPPNASSFQPCSYPFSYNYRPFSSTGSYFPIHPQPPYSHASSNHLIPKMVKGMTKHDSDSNSSSSSTEPIEK